MKHSTIIISLMALMGCSLGTKAELRYGVTAGTNATIISTEYGANCVLRPGAELGGILRSTFESNWIAEARLNVTYTSYGVGAYNVPALTGPQIMHAMQYRYLTASIPVMGGYALPASDKVSLYGLLGPSLTYRPIVEKRTRDNGEWPSWADVNYKINHWSVDAHVKIGAEFCGHHRAEISYATNISNIVSGSSRRLHIVGFNYAYMF